MVLPSKNSLLIPSIYKYILLSTNIPIRQTFHLEKYQENPQNWNIYIFISRSFCVIKQFKSVWGIVTVCDRIKIWVLLGYVSLKSLLCSIQTSIAKNCKELALLPILIHVTLWFTLRFAYLWKYITI